MKKRILIVLVIITLFFTLIYMWKEKSKEKVKTEEKIIENIVEGSNIEEKQKDIIVEYKIDQTWQENNKNALKYNVKIINKSNKDIENWKIKFNVNETTEVKQFWNGKIEKSNSELVVSPEEYNNIIKSNNQIELGGILIDTKETSINGYKLYINDEKYIETVKKDVKKETENDNEETYNSEEKNPVNMHGKLSVKGINIVDKNEKGFIIQGVSTHGIAWFPQYINYETFKTLRDDFNVNTIRLAMYSDKNSGYNSSLHKKVEEGVEYAKQLGMYVIIDWHILNDNNPNQNKEDAITFFTEMANKYKDYNNVLYEICNEPNGNVTWERDIKPYAEEVIGIIRKIDNDAIIIVGTPTWSQDVDIVSNNPIANYENIVYALHFYAATHKEDLRNKLKTALSNNLPILVSEFGICDASGNGEINTEEANKWINLLRENTIGYVCWNLSNKNEASSILKSTTNSIKQWQDDELSKCGQWLKSTYNNLTNEN